MSFASPLPWWLALLVAAAVAGVAYFSYRRPIVPLSGTARAVLMALRGLGVAAIIVMLCRPTVPLPPSAGEPSEVPVLIDVSRSMRIPDADGRSRLDRAIEWAGEVLVPALPPGMTPRIYTVGDTVEQASLEGLSADARRSDLAAAVRTIRDRQQGRRTAGVVLVSDGGDSGRHLEPIDGPGPPVFAVGVGSLEGVPDREVAGVVAGDPRLDESSVDLQVSALGRGFGRAPFDLQVSANGRLVEARTVTPSAEGSPVEEIFTVFPDGLTPTIYRIEIATDVSEVVTENNARSILVAPPGRKRRILMLAGAPGYEHSFLARALASDSGLEVDLVVRKGRNEAGEPTFLVQAAGTRATALTSGFPATRAALFDYDALIIANVEGEFFTQAQLSLAADFVATRGGGLLVLGGRSLAERGLIGTPLEAALPLELSDRRGGLTRAVFDPEHLVGHNMVRLTPDGERHPIMRLDATPAESQRRWASMPALAGSTPLGGPRPGAVVLALTAAQNGAMSPLVAVQRYGRGRSLVFAGEASWRWRMLLPAADLAYEHFWRQGVRWLATAAPDRVELVLPDEAEPGETLPIGVDVHSATFEAATGATVEVTVDSPGGSSMSIALGPDVSGPGRWVGVFEAPEPGAYRVRASARDGATPLGVTERWLGVGGGEREFADPRLNEGVLRRLAGATGGRYAKVGDASAVTEWLGSTAAAVSAMGRRDVWHQPWTLVLVIGLLSAEWVLRRRWGMR